MLECCCYYSSKGNSNYTPTVGWCRPVPTDGASSWSTCRGRSLGGAHPNTSLQTLPACREETVTVSFALLLFYYTFRTGFPDAAVLYFSSSLRCDVMLVHWCTVWSWASVYWSLWRQHVTQASTIGHKAASMCWNENNPTDTWIIDLFYSKLQDNNATQMNRS